MPDPVVDISVLGDKGLEMRLGTFHPRIQRKVLRQVMRRSVKRLKGHIVRNLSGDPVAPDTGRYLAAMIEAKPKALKRSRTQIGVGIAMPEREKLGIPPDYKKGYYPFSLEYGYMRMERAPVIVPARAPIRRAVNAHTNEELGIMRREIGDGIEREAQRHFAKVKAG